MSKLTKYEKETIVLFNGGEMQHTSKPTTPAEEQTGDVLQEAPRPFRLEKSHEQGGVSYVLDKSRLSIRLQPPYSEERRRKASKNASKTVSPVRWNNVAFRVDMQSKHRMLTRHFDCSYIQEYKVLPYHKYAKMSVS